MDFPPLNFGSFDGSCGSGEQLIPFLLALRSTGQRRDCFDGVASFGGSGGVGHDSYILYMGKAGTI